MVRARGRGELVLTTTLVHTMVNAAFVYAVKACGLHSAPNLGTPRFMSLRAPSRLSATTSARYLAGAFSARRARAATPHLTTCSMQRSASLVALP